MSEENLYTIRNVAVKEAIDFFIYGDGQVDGKPSWDLFRMFLKSSFNFDEHQIDRIVEGIRLEGY